MKRSISFSLVVVLLTVTVGVRVDALVIDIPKLNDSPVLGEAPEPKDTFPGFPDLPTFPEPNAPPPEVSIVIAVNQALGELKDAQEHVEVAAALDVLLARLTAYVAFFDDGETFATAEHAALIRGLERIFELALAAATLEVGETTPFVRGDANVDGQVDLSDAGTMLAFLFLGGDDPDCQDAADVDDSGEVEISDAMKLLNSLFLGGSPPAAPYPSCGLDSTEDELNCSATNCAPEPYTHDGFFLGSPEFSVCFLGMFGDCQADVVPAGTESCVRTNAFFSVNFCLWEVSAEAAADPSE